MLSQKYGVYTLRMVPVMAIEIRNVRKVAFAQGTLLRYG
jgi:hypothetical protein